jgi:hypothetical protein
MTDQCRTFTTGDPEPGPEITAVRDRDLDLWRRVPDGWICRRPDAAPAAWSAVLGIGAPLIDCSSEFAAQDYLDESLDHLPTPKYRTFAQAQAAGFPDEYGCRTVPRDDYCPTFPLQYPARIFRRDIEAQRELISQRITDAYGVPAESSLGWRVTSEPGGSDQVQDWLAQLDESIRNFQARFRPPRSGEVPVDESEDVFTLPANEQFVVRLYSDEMRAAVETRAAAEQAAVWSTHAWSQPTWRGIENVPSPDSGDQLAWLDEAVPDFGPATLHQVLANVETQPLERDLDYSAALNTAIARGWVKIDRGGRWRRRRVRLTELGKRQLRRLRGT